MQHAPSQSSTRPSTPTSTWTAVHRLLSADVILQKASALNILGRVDAAKAIFSTLAKQTQNDPTVMISYGMLLEELGELQLAEEMYWVALEEKPDYVVVTTLTT